jgi:hypothetical protein
VRSTHSPLIAATGQENELERITALNEKLQIELEMHKKELEEMTALRNKLIIENQQWMEKDKKAQEELDLLQSIIDEYDGQAFE